MATLFRWRAAQEVHSLDDQNHSRPLMPCRRFRGRRLLARVVWKQCRTISPAQRHDHSQRREREGHQCRHARHRSVAAICEEPTHSRQWRTHGRGGAALPTAGCTIPGSNWASGRGGWGRRRATGSAAVWSRRPLRYAALLIFLARQLRCDATRYKCSRQRHQCQPIFG
jgi:hypothetical protein